MMRKVVISFGVLLALLAGVSCSRESLSQGTVTLFFQIPEMQTRTATPGDNNPEDGGAIAVDASVPDLVVLVADGNGNIVATWPDFDPNDSYSSSCSVTTANTAASVSFTGFSGTGSYVDYTVFAIANTKGGIWGMPADEDGWKALTTATQVEALQFTSLTGTDCPVPASDRIPLSAKGTLTINPAGNGEVRLELLRCVAKVSVSFKNVTGGTLNLSGVNLSIGDMNPKWGKLILPSSLDTPTLEDDFRSLGMSKASMSLANGETKSLTESNGIPYYVFPSEARGGTYYCSASFHWTCTKPDPTDPNANPPIETQGDYATTAPHLRIYDRNTYQDIPALGRNQHLQIEIRVASGSSVSFNFIVSNWEEYTENVEFD